MSSPYVFALISTTSFSLASFFFTDLSRKTSVVWMNAFKATIALLCFAVATLLFERHSPMSAQAFAALFASGVIGLGIGDVFLFIAFARMGSARTLVIYGFEPLFLGVGARILFQQHLAPGKGLAIVFFLICLLLFSFEKFRATGKWEILGLAAAILGVLLDNVGVLLTRWAFDQAPGLGVFEANLIRSSGAVLLFLLVLPLARVNLWRGFTKLRFKQKSLAIFASALGTFFALYFYLSAIRAGNLATIAAIVASAPILSAAIESVHQRKAPTCYLLASLLFFILGFLVLARF